MFGRKKRTVKEEVAKELSDKLGISEEEALKTLNEIQSKIAIFNSKFIDMLATNEKFINALCKNEKLIDALAKKLDFNLTRRLILATGALGALTLGTGTAGAKLVLTDKFVELDGQKFYPASVGAYDVIVMKDDANVWAEDRFGKVIAEGVSGEDDADVIQSVIDSNKIVYIHSGYYHINKPIIINKKKYWSLRFSKGARFAIDNNTEEGGDLGLNDYVIKVIGTRREDNENFEIINPHIVNSYGCIYIDYSAWFSIIGGVLISPEKNALYIDYSNSFQVNIEEITGSKKSSENIGILLGKKGDGTSDCIINVMRIISFHTGIVVGDPTADWWCENVVIRCFIESCKYGIFGKSFRNLIISHSYLEKNKIHIYIYNPGYYYPVNLIVEKSFFAYKEEADIVQEKYMSGRLIVKKDNFQISKIRIKGPEFYGVAELPIEPEEFNSIVNGRLIVNGIGREAAGAGNPPNNPNWKEGDIVENTDDKTIWIKRSDGQWVKISS